MKTEINWIDPQVVLPGLDKYILMYYEYEGYNWFSEGRLGWSDELEGYYFIPAFFTGRLKEINLIFWAAKPDLGNK